MWLTAHGYYHAAFILSTRMTRKARIVFVMMPKPVNYKSASSASSAPKKLPGNCDLLTFMIPSPVLILYIRANSSSKLYEIFKTEKSGSFSRKFQLQSLFSRSATRKYLIHNDMTFRLHCIEKIYSNSLFLVNKQLQSCFQLLCRLPISGFYGFLRIVRAEGFQTGKPFLPRCAA